jgi:hypothetical protein
MAGVRRPPPSAWWFAAPSIAVLALLFGAAVWFGLSENEEEAAPAWDDAELTPPVPETIRSNRAGTAQRATPPAVEPPSVALEQVSPALPPVDSEDERSGIAAFPPPGTKPLKRGLVVPDDYELPPGYVRHYQATDDGRRVPAILLFHPDFRPVDAEGKPIPMPVDRVVPPELAPPGFPLEQLVVPDESASETGQARWPQRNER